MIKGLDPGNSLEVLRAAVAVATAPQLAALRDEALVHYRLLTTTWLDRAFLDLAGALDANVLFECGAHEAWASVAFLSAGGKAAIAVEANPKTYDAITRTAADSGVTVLNCGLGESEGVAPFFIPRGAETAANASFLRKPGGQYHQVKVPVTTIDSLTRKHLEVDDRLALWVDVEGLATEVLTGGRSTLRDSRCKILKIEVESHSYWKGQSLVDETHNLLVECGLIPVLRDIEYPNQYNLIYVRADLAPLLDELLLTKWAELAALRPTKLPRAVRATVHSIKNRLMRESSGPLFFHRVAAAFGSISSAKVVEAEKLRQRDKH